MVQAQVFVSWLPSSSCFLSTAFLVTRLRPSLDIHAATNPLNTRLLVCESFRINFLF